MRVILWTIYESNYETSGEFLSTSEPVNSHVAPVPLPFIANVIGAFEPSESFKSLTVVLSEERMDGRSIIRTHPTASNASRIGIWLVAFLRYDFFQVPTVNVRVSASHFGRTVSTCGSGDNLNRASLIVKPSAWEMVIPHSLQMCLTS